MGVQERTLSGEEVGALDQLATDYRGLSVADLSALYVASVEKYILLTDDGNLRKVTQSKRVQCHGTLWLLEALVRQAQMTPQEACKALENMMNRGARFPHSEVSSLRRRWQCP